ncbi:MAG: hypothetical protein HQK51_20810, partial [Oligoflexia bacterium]|nr:hypothetical protein [Oligoflexia bacterium]
MFLEMLTEIGIPIIYLIFLFLFFSILGFPLFYKLNDKLKSLSLLPILGLAISSVVITILFSFNLKMFYIFSLMMIVFVFILFFYFKDILQIINTIKNKSNKDLQLNIIIVVVALFLLLLPQFVGGLRFSIFQGNHFDHFGYWESAQVFARESYREILGHKAD